jgi:outer membrane protein TolC
MKRMRWGTPGLLTAAAGLLIGALGAAPVVTAQETVNLNADLPMLSLGDCVNLALGSSPTLLVADEQRHIAAQDVKAAWWGFAPDVSLSRTWSKAERKDFDVEQMSPATFQTVDSAGDITTWQTSAPNGTFADETINTKYKDWGGRASLNVFRGFAKFSNLSASKHYLRAAEASAGYSREQVVQDVVMAYYILLRSAELLEVAIETRDQVAKELEKTETYFRLGSAAKSDVLQQRVQLENTRLEVVRADNAVKMAFADLAFSMNRPLVSAFQVDRSILDTDFAVEPVDALFAEALGNRLDLRSNEHNVDARRKDVTTATATAWPSIDLFANYSRYENDSPYRFGSQQSESNSFGYQVNWAVFDRWVTWRNRSQAKANARIAEYQLDQAKLNAQVEIRQLYNLAIEARELAKVSRETIVQSEEELRLAQERFRVGAGTTLDIIVAQANLANARGEEVRAKCDFLIAQAQLHRAVGRLSPWTVEAPAP